MNCQLEQTPGYGRCCCNCTHQMVALCHPWNKEVGKGRITKIMGYLCAAPDFETPDDDKSAVFFEDKHGLCEMWVKK